MPQGELTINLADASIAEVDRVGGKAANLGHLIKNGFQVPRGFVVTTEAYLLFAIENNLQTVIEKELAEVNYENPHSVEEHAQCIKEAISASRLPERLTREIKEKYSEMGSLPVAVRSSATTEDLVKASFAGQLETYLNITTSEQVLESVKKCYASLWSSRVLAYSKRSSLRVEDAKMAVIIQNMIQSKSSGVLFTVSPISTEDSELLIESTFGLGEALVSGRASPDRYVLSRMNNGTFRILVKEIAAKKIVAQIKDNNVEYTEIDEDYGSKPSISDEQALKLAEIGESIQLYMGTPQDIEWTIDSEGEIHILQSRPITTFRSGTKDEVVWTRGYSDDYWNDPVTPLFFELLGDHLTKYVNVELNEIMGYSSLNSEKTRQLLRLHKAHAYFNLEVLKMKVENEIPPFLRNDDVLNYFPEGSGLYGKDTMRKLRFNTFGRIWAEVRVTFKDPNGSGSKTDKAYEAWTNEIFNPFSASFEEKLKRAESSSLNDCLKVADEVNSIMIDHFRLVRYGIPVHNIGMNLLSQYLLERFLGAEEGRRTYPVLVSGLKHKTSQTNEEIDRLASKVRASDTLRNMIASESSRDLYEIISKSSNEEVILFKHDLDSFLREYGVRGFTREIYYPRWIDEPRYLFDILKSLSSGDSINIEAIEEKNEKRRIETEERVSRSIREQSLGFAKWRLVSSILNSARRYIIFREQQRFNLDKWITMNRRLYLSISKRLVEEDKLVELSDIFFLKKMEIRNLISNGYDKPPLSVIEERKVDFQKYENATPPKFLQGDREFNDPAPTETRSFKGIPASQGILTGTIRVLESIDDIWQVQVGEILIVPRTDPGWTPVFSKIGGLITETGGILSHGAVVSREYGIPAVTNVHNACKNFKTGERVTIDGVKGEVTIER